MAPAHWVRSTPRILHARGTTYHWLRAARGQNHYFIGEDELTYKMEPGKELDIKVDFVYDREEALKVIAAAEKDYWANFEELHAEARK